MSRVWSQLLLEYLNLLILCSCGWNLDFDACFVKSLSVVYQYLLNISKLWLFAAAAVLVSCKWCFSLSRQLEEPDPASSDFPTCQFCPLFVCRPLFPSIKNYHPEPATLLHYASLSSTIQHYPALATTTQCAPLSWTQLLSLLSSSIYLTIVHFP